MPDFEPFINTNEANVAGYLIHGRVHALYEPLAFLVGWAGFISAKYISLPDPCEHAAQSRTVLLLRARERGSFLG